MYTYIYICIHTCIYVYIYICISISWLAMAHEACGVRHAAHVSIRQHTSAYASYGARSMRREACSTHTTQTHTVHGE